MKNILSLFDGMSCGQIALNRAGIEYENYYASEINKHAIQIAQKNYPDTIQLGDVKNISIQDLPEIDLLIGGSPCQGFSLSGNGLNFNDPRSALFFEYERILKECKPKYFLLENVRMKKEWENIITSKMNVFPIIINSNLVSAQNRSRLYWTNIPNINQPQDKGIKLKDIIEKEVDKKYYLKPETVERIKNYIRGKKFFNIDSEKTGTLTALYARNPSDGCYFEDEYGVRRYSVEECERLQTVPAGYTEGVSNVHRYEMLGNGWTIDVIAHIFRFLEKDKEKKEVVDGLDWLE